MVDIILIVIDKTNSIFYNDLYSTFGGCSMVINANEVKKRGVSIFGELLKKFDEVVISFRGKKRYVVLDIKRYEELREKELELSYQEVMKDYKKGNFHTDIQKHMQEIDNV